jgi:hypothetical protein
VSGLIWTAALLLVCTAKVDSSQTFLSPDHTLDLYPISATSNEFGLNVDSDRAVCSSLNGRKYTIMLSLSGFDFLEIATLFAGDSCELEVSISNSQSGNERHVARKAA